MNTKLLIAPFVLAMAVSTARAQNGPSIPPEVETVISGGDWITKDSVEGHYRIVIETEGLEHLISRLRVEWIADPSKSDTPAKIVAVQEVPIGAGGVYLTAPTIGLEVGRWILTVDATNTHCDPMPTERWRIALNLPAQAKVLDSTVIKRGCE